MLWLWGCGALIRGVLHADVPGSLSLTLAFRGVEDRGVGGPALSRLNHRVPRRSGRGCFNVAGRGDQILGWGWAEKSMAAPS